MAAPTTSVTRDLDSSGDEIKAYQDGLTTPGARVVQAMALDPEIQGCLLTNAVTNATAVDQSAVIATAGALLFRAEVVLTTGVAGDRWLFVVDKASAAAGADLPAWRSPKLSGDWASLEFGNFGLQMTNGIVLALSSTPDDLTLPGGGGDGFFQFSYALPST